MLIIRGISRAAGGAVVLQSGTWRGVVATVSDRRRLSARLTSDCPQTQPSEGLG